MDILDLFAGLEFDNDTGLYQQIQPMLSNWILIVENQNSFLALKAKPGLGQLNRHSFFINFFKKARAKCTMNSNATTQDSLGKFFLNQRHRFVFRASVFSRFRDKITSGSSASA
jgi:hypothetical protein